MDEMTEVPTGQGQVHTLDDPGRTQVVKATCPRCQTEAIYGLPVAPTAFTVACVNCKQPFRIEPPSGAYSDAAPPNGSTR